MSRTRFLYLLVFTVGLSILGAEIAAARLMAPFFGASTIVWANTIGIVLVALSIGYWLGGRFADRHPTLEGLCTAVLLGAVMVALVPFVSRPFFDISVGALDSIEAGAFVGSLFAVLVLIALPVMVLGACTPWALRLAMRDVEHSGETAGRLYAISTVGSLTGTMLSALLLIPFIGTQRTFLVFALCLALVGALGLLRARRLALVVPLAVAGALAMPVGTVKATDRGTVIHETESETQYIRVVERDNGDRLLELNEGQAIHSLYRPGTFLTDNVWDGFLVAPFAALGGPPESLVILGNAAGTTPRAYGHYFPRTAIDGIEIDSKLEDIGRRYFDMENPSLTVHRDDARPWLRRNEGPFEAIFVDAYRQPYIPFYLSTREFFELTLERLEPGGVVVVNAGHPEGNDDLETVLARTMADVYEHVARWPVTATNTLLIASQAELTAERLREGAAGGPAEIRSLARRAASELGERLEGGRVYTDDVAPVEWLIDRSIIGYAAGD